MNTGRDSKETMQEPISRAPQILDTDDFKTLFGLNKKHSWLEKRQNALFDLWSSCKTLEEQKLIIELLDRYTFLNHDKIDESLSQIQNQITNQWKLSPKTTYLVGIDKENVSDSSKAILWLLQPHFAKLDDWNKEDFFLTIGQAIHRISNNCNIVFLDDFSGTGNKIIRKIKWFQERLSNKGLDSINIKVSCIAAMERAKEEIEALEVELFTPNLLKKGISDYYPPEQVEEKLENMKRLESALGRRSCSLAKRVFPFGYGQSETLYGMEIGNIPNNVFPIFWWRYRSDSQIRSTLFQRLY